MKKTSSVTERILRKFSISYSKNSLVRSDESPILRSEILTWVNTGDEIVNSVLGSKEEGIPSGKIIEIFGEESTGKTALALKLLSIFQLVGGIGFLADVAGDYRAKRAREIGLDTKELLNLQLEEIVTKKRGKPDEVTLEGLEDLFDKFLGVIRVSKEEASDIPTLIVWDDVAGTPPRAQLSGEYEPDAIAAHARLMSSGMRRINSELRGSCVTLVCVNQVRANIGYFTGGVTTPGGRALKFYSTVRVQLRRMRKKSNLIECKMYNKKNKAGPPYEEAGFSVRFKPGAVEWES